MQLSTAAYTPAALRDWVNRSFILRSILLVVIGSLLLAVSARIEVPMIPVPITMQSFALLLIGAYYGSRLAFATACAYLLEGALGLPVFAGGAGGAIHLIGPTAGYLAAFPFAAGFVGFAVERGWITNIFAAFGVMMISHAIVFLGGVIWLATFTGPEKAFALGFMPFIYGTLIKSALAAAIVRLSVRRK